MQLPDVLETRRGAENLIGLHRSALAGAVLHDRDARADAVDECVGTGPRQPVVGHHVEVDGADRIVRAHQLELLVPEQVAEIEQRETARTRSRRPPSARFRRESQGLPSSGSSAQAGFGRPPPGSGFFEHLAAGGDDANVDAGDGHAIAGLHDRVLGLAVELRVRSLKALDLLALLDDGP